MPYDQSTLLGLNTDSPPDRLGDQAARVRNMVPRSASSLIPRGGSSLEKHYIDSSLGRKIVVDALPGDLGNALLIATVNTTESGGALTHTVEGLGRFKPRRIAQDYAAQSGLSLVNNLYGIVEPGTYPNASMNPTTLAYLAGTKTAMSGTLELAATSHTFYVRDCIVIAPGTYYNNDTETWTEYADGLLVCVCEYEDAVINCMTFASIFNLTDGTLLTAEYYDQLQSPTAAGSTLGCKKACPFPSGFPGVVIPREVDGDTKLIFYYLGYAQIIGPSLGSVTLCDIGPMSSTDDPYFHVCLYNTSNGTAQLEIWYISRDRSIWATGDSPGTPTQQTTQEFTAASHANWAARPDTMLWAQFIRNNGYAIFGDYVDDDPVVNVDNAKLAHLDQDYNVITSHAESATGKVFGACTDGQGNVFVTGTRDIVNDAADKILCKYKVTPDGWNLEASITHAGAGAGLGGGSAASADTKILNPIWDGYRLIVEDWESTLSRMFVYDTDLNQIGSVFTLLTQASNSEPRWKGGRYCTTWFNKNF